MGEAFGLLAFPLFGGKEVGEAFGPLGFPLFDGCSLWTLNTTLANQSSTMSFATLQSSTMMMDAMCNSWLLLSFINVGHPGDDIRLQ